MLKYFYGLLTKGKDMKDLEVDSRWPQEIDEDAWDFFGNSRSGVPFGYLSNEEVTFESLQNEIRDRAYIKWEEAGWPCGDGNSFWIAAEEEMFGPNPLQKGGYLIYFWDQNEYCMKRICPHGNYKVDLQDSELGL